jgi:alpha-tubulin suppressor-like RCC1 family protein
LGEMVFDSRWHEESFVQVAAGTSHTLARRSDGSVVAWGNNSYGQCNVPALAPGLSYVEMAAGERHTVARRSDGSVVAWGWNGWGQCNVPALPPGLSYVEVAAGSLHTVARRSDGSVVAWGANTHGQCNVPALPPGLSYVEVAAASPYGRAAQRRQRGGMGRQRLWPVQRAGAASGLSTSRWLRGTATPSHVAATAAWWPGATTIRPVQRAALPPGLSYVEVAAGCAHTVARRSDGSVVAWGDNAWPVQRAGAAAGSVLRRGGGGLRHTPHGSASQRRQRRGMGRQRLGQCNVPALPPGLSYVEVAAGEWHAVARRSDGSVVAWGNNYSVSATCRRCRRVCPTSSWRRRRHTVARRSDGSVVAWGYGTMASATCRRCRRVCPTSRWRRVGLTQ